MSDSLGHLFANVWRPRLLGYVAAMLCVAVALYLLGLPGVSGISIFAVVCLVWALVFPVRWQALPKNAADFWYYLLAGIGVVLFFANASEQRDKIAAAQRFNSLTVELSDLEARQSRIGRAVTSPSDFFEKIKLTARNAYQFQEANPSACSDALAADLNKDLRIDMKRHLDGRKPEVPSLDLNPSIAPAICELYSLRNEFLALSGLASIHELPAFLEKSRLKNQDKALGPIDGVTLAEFVEYITDGLTGKWKDKNAHLAGELEDAKAQYRDIGSTLAPDFGLKLKGIQHFLWPYLILMALALKIARVRYCGAEGRDKE